MENDGDLTPHTGVPSEAQQRAEERKRLLRSTSAPPSQHCAGGCPWSLSGKDVKEMDMNMDMDCVT